MSWLQLRNEKNKPQMGGSSVALCSCLVVERNEERERQNRLERHASSARKRLKRASMLFRSLPFHSTPSSFQGRVVKDQALNIHPRISNTPTPPTARRVSSRLYRRRRIAGLGSPAALSSKQAFKSTGTGKIASG